MDVLNPGLLGTADRFRERYAVPIERHGSDEAAPRLRTVTRPYLLRRVKTDPTIIDDLPEKIEITQHYRLTPEQATLYRTVVDDMMEKIEDAQGIQRRGNVLAAMAKLKQVCNHPAQLLHDGSALGRRSGKVVRLEEILAEILAEGDRVLCFTQFTEFGHLLVPHLSARFDTDVAFLHGGTPKKRRDEMVARFQAGEGPPVMLLSLKAGGTGLTLTAANHVVHLDRWWNPAVENQATDRAFRIGQRRNVQVRKFLCPGTVEERIEAMIAQKTALSGMVVGEGENWLTELSTDSLRVAVHCSTRRRRWTSHDEPVSRATGGSTPRRPGRSRSRAASRSTPPAARWPARGGRSGSSPCWSRSGSAAGWPAAAPTPGRARSSRSTSTPGGAVAKVQGSRPRPYAVRVGVSAFGKAEWAEVAQAMVADASLTAALLAGEMPHEIEDVFTRVGLSLFPASARDLALDCTLPRPGRAVQAPGRGLLRAGRAVRRRPVRDAGPARARPGDAARRSPGAPGRARGPLRRTAPRWPRCCRSSTPEAPCPRPRPGPDTPSDALLDQVPPFPVEIRGITVTELLRPAYRALGGA